MGPGQPLRPLQPQHPTPVWRDRDTQEDRGGEQNGECVQAGVGVGGGAAPRRLRRTAGGARPQSKCRRLGGEERVLSGEQQQERSRGGATPWGESPGGVQSGRRPDGTWKGGRGGGLSRGWGG